MLGRINYGCLIVVVTGAILLPAARPAHAQWPAAYGYYPAAPAVAYVPEARGLFGLHTVYRPVAVYPYAPMTTYYAPSAATTLYYPSANVASYYGTAPTSYYAPATTMYYPSANVTSYYRGPLRPVVLLPTRDHDVLRAGECHEPLRSGSTVLHGHSARLRAVCPASHDPVQCDWAVMPGHAGLATNGNKATNGI